MTLADAPPLSPDSIQAAFELLLAGAQAEPDPRRRQRLAGHALIQMLAASGQAEEAFGDALVADEMDLARFDTGERLQGRAAVMRRCASAQEDGSHIGAATQVRVAVDDWGVATEETRCELVGSQDSATLQAERKDPPGTRYLRIAVQATVWMFDAEGRLASLRIYPAKGSAVTRLPTDGVPQAAAVARALAPSIARARALLASA